MLVFGNPDSEFVRATFRGHAYPDLEDSEGNWLMLRIEVVTAPFSGSFDGMWRAEFLAPFRRGVQYLYSTLDGTSVPTGRGASNFGCKETLWVTSSSTARCARTLGPGPWLRFLLPKIDLTYLPGTCQVE
jgi:hypothetical protein